MWRSLSCTHRYNTQDGLTGYAGSAGDPPYSISRQGQKSAGTMYSLRPIARPWGIVYRIFRVSLSGKTDHTDWKHKRITGISIFGWKH